MNNTSSMAHTLQKWTGMCTLFLLLLDAAPASAIEGVRELVQEGRLRVTTNVARPQSPLYVKQAVIVHVEVATQGRFNGGTRIRGLQVAEAIVLPPPAFAVNATRVESGSSWAVQTWTLKLYPLKEKQYLLPALSLDVELVDKNGIERRGVLKTTPQSFTAVLPPNAAKKGAWIAAEKVTLTNTVSGPTKDIEPGAAVTRTILIEAEGVPGMMLEHAATASIPGLAAYPDAPKVTTKSNRGKLVGARRQKTTYIVQKPGRYLLPAITLNWWNIRTNQWEQAEAPAQLIETKGVSSTAPLIKAARSGDDGQSFPIDWIGFVVAASLLGGLGLLVLLIKHYPAEFVMHWKLRRHVRKALAAGKTMRAIRLFYQWYDQYSSSPKTPSVRATSSNANFEALMEKGYSGHAAKGDAIEVDTIFSSVDKSQTLDQTQSKPFSLND